VPLEVPVPALAEVQLALQEAAAKVTGERGDALKRRLRTGTVVSYDDRNWELRWSQERRRIGLGRCIAVDMESAALATQGYRLRVPYGTLLCVSDKSRCTARSSCRAPRRASTSARSASISGSASRRSICCAASWALLHSRKLRRLRRAAISLRRPSSTVFDRFHRLFARGK